jgi:cytochrome c oxidase assembly factor CtaG
VSPDASWTFSPGAIALLLIVTGWYVHRWRAVDESPLRLALFLLGILVTAAALLSPIDILGEQLFFFHMIQHLLLLDIAAILVILGLTRKILRPVTKRMLNVERKAGFFATPVFAITLYVLVMWIWHIPAMYDAALEHSGIHVLEHLTFAFAGGLYWWHIFSPIRSRHRLMGLGPAAYMISTKILVGMLGVFLTFAPDSFYGFYEELPRFWGLSPSEDQAVGGAIMALEQMIVMGAAFGWLFVRMLSESELEEQRAARFGPRARALRAVGLDDEDPYEGKLPSSAPRAPRPRPLVHAAFDAAAPGRVSLNAKEQRTELERQGGPAEGLPLRLRDDAGHEVDAVATWDAEWGGWFAQYEPEQASTRLTRPTGGAPA